MAFHTRRPSTKRMMTKYLGRKGQQQHLREKQFTNPLSITTSNISNNGSNKRDNSSEYQRFHHGYLHKRILPNTYPTILSPKASSLSAHHSSNIFHTFSHPSAYQQSINYSCAYFSTKPPNNDDKDDESNTKSSSSSSRTTTTASKSTDQNDKIDQEFQQYLKGSDTTPTNEPPNTPPLEEWYNQPLSDGTILQQEQIHESQNLQSTLPELNATYHKIEETQQSNLEKQRQRRVVTVRRALMGNFLITVFKFGGFVHSGSSALLSEFIHSVVDCGNQSLLLIGLRDSGNQADRSHPYGYGKSIYFWALVSALGTFFLGAGVSMTQALPELVYGSSIRDITWHVWAILGFSFVVDGYVFTKTVLEVKESMPKDDTKSLWSQVRGVRDPATLAILLEDGAACAGIVIAISGIALTQAYDNPVFDAAAGVGISGLLAAMGLILVRVNHAFLLGQAVDQDIIKGIEQILLNRRSIDAVHSVQSQWTGPETFSYKAEVDFDGTFLAAKLMPRYQTEFDKAKKTLDQDLRVLLSWYAEDVMRTVEREVKNIESQIRREYPGAQYIELEPMSKDADRFAIDDGMEAQLKRIEIEALNRYLKSLYSTPKKE